VVRQRIVFVSFVFFVLDQPMYLAEYTGKGVRIAVIDSGVHADHPHVGGVSGGVGIHDDGMLDDDFLDRLGHGTAVAAAIREKAPAVEIIAIKVFWRSLKTSVTTLVCAIDQGVARGAAIINLSLGTADDRHRGELASAVVRAGAAGVLIVSAIEDGGVRWLPGDLSGVVPVQLDWTCARDSYRIVSEHGRSIVAASGYPRDIPGVPRERNLKGISFAVANASAFVARALEAAPRANAATVFTTLERSAAGQLPG
jgi:subtilisin family serine protease